MRDVIQRLGVVLLMVGFLFACGTDGPATVTPEEAEEALKKTVSPEPLNSSSQTDTEKKTS